MTRTKAEWRRVLLAARTGLDPSARRERNVDLLERVAALVCYGSASSLFGYVAIGREVDPRTLLERSSASTIVVPIMSAADDAPRWRKWMPGDTGENARELPSLDDVRFPAVVLAPGVGFDETGTRLGRGRGFYDRALASLRRAGDVCVVGLGFECQIVPELPADPWDQRVDYVVSERRVIANRRAARDSAVGPR